jgi:Flp pilus assembly protein TadD
MTKYAAIAALLLLSACQGMGGMQPIDSKSFLSSLEGPKVTTVEESQLETARNLDKARDFKAAAQIYQQLLDKKPGDKELTLLLADSLRRNGDNDKALALYDSLLQKDPAHLAAKEGKGLALMSTGDFDTPIPLFEDVMRTDATRWKTLNALGILFATRNMHSEAQQYFREALRQSPSNISVLNNLGLSQALDRNFDTASSTLLQASELAATGGSDKKRIDLNLALVYAIAGKLENATNIAQRYLTGSALNNNLGLYAHLAKDDQLAKAYLNMALTQSKTFYEKAWDNLQTLETNRSDGDKPSPPLARQLIPSPPPAAPVQAAVPEAPAAAPVAKPKPRKDKKSKSSVDDQIINILNQTGEDMSGDVVKDSPIP